MINIIDVAERMRMVRLAKNERSKKYYDEKTKQKLIDCDVCSCKVNPYYYQEHLETKRHKKWSEIKNKHE